MLTGKLGVENEEDPKDPVMSGDEFVIVKVAFDVGVHVSEELRREGREGTITFPPERV